jgi:hypothetical protein
MSRPSLGPRIALHLLSAFIVVALLLIFLFPTLSYAQSVYHSTHEAVSIGGLPTQTPPQSNILIKNPHAAESIGYEASRSEKIERMPDSPQQARVLETLVASFKEGWRTITLTGRLLWFVVQPLVIVAIFLIDKLLFLIHPFIILGTGVYILTIRWPVQLFIYLSKTFYGLYLFLACASIIGLLVGAAAYFLTTYLNNRIFPRPPRVSQPATSRPLTSDSQLSSDTTFLAHSIRAPPPSKHPSGAQDVHILDTNALFNSFSLPHPPPTPPPILISAPTPVVSATGLLGDTIFEEEDDSDDRTPIASTSAHSQTWRFGAGRPVKRPGSEHGREFVKVETVSGGTWHPVVKKESVGLAGLDWGDPGVRRRKMGAV